MSNNTDGYTNGVNHYPPTYRDAGSARIGREYRSGGYGGFEAADGNFAVPHDSDDAPSTSIDERSTGTDVGYGTARQAFSTRNQAGWQHAGRHAPRDGPRDLSTTYGHGQGGRQIEGTHCRLVENTAHFCHCTFMIYCIISRYTAIGA